MIRIYFGIVLFVLYANPVLADFSCTAEVRYRWIPDKVVAPIVKTPEAKGGAEAAKEPVKEDSGINEVFWGTIEARAFDEVLAKQKLAEALNKERGKSDTSCRDVHENQTKCIAGKYSQNAAVLSMMSFTQRKEFEKTIITDCTNSTGRCAGSMTTEPICREIKDKDSPKEAPPEEKKGKESKKK